MPEINGSLPSYSFLYTKLLSLRPLLQMATQTGGNRAQKYQVQTCTLDTDLVQRCCKLCVTTAHNLIETIFQHIDTRYKSFGWHSVYCEILQASEIPDNLTNAALIVIFASATILLASIKGGQLQFNGEHSLERSWGRCLKVLEHFKERIQITHRVIQVLEELRQQIEMEQSNGWFVLFYEPKFFPRIPITIFALCLLCNDRRPIIE